MVEDATREVKEREKETLLRLARAGEFRDEETGNHLIRMSRYSRLIAQTLGLERDETETIELAAPLHDIGKIGVPDNILLKLGKLTQDEYDVIKTHTAIGARILSGSSHLLLQMAEQIALTHHERWDGGGYPAGLSGEEIPLAGRIVAVADVFDALTHERPYKEAWPVEKAVDEILGQAGGQFDPGVVVSFSALDHQSLLTRVRDAASLGESGLPRSEARLRAHA